MAWPDDQDLQVRVEAAFGADLTANSSSWVWTDLSSRLLADPIRIRAGKSSGARYVSPSTCMVTLDNDDGALTPDNPMSAYWPNVQLGTPLRVSVLWGGVWRQRFAGFADQWQPDFVPTTTPGQAHSVVRVTASGLLRRLSQGTPPTRSAMRRTIPATGALAYWPVEDGTNASVAASAYPGHAQLTIAGTVEFRTIESWVESRGYEVRYGTAALADVSAGASLSAPVPASVTAATTTGWTVALAADTSGGVRSGDLVLAEVSTPGGTYVRWRLVLTTTGRTQIIGFTATNTSTTVVDEAVQFEAMVDHNFSVWQDGGLIRAGYWWDSVSGYAASGSTSGTLRGVTAVAVNPTGVTCTGPLPVGHLAVWAGRNLPALDARDGAVLMSLFGWAWSNIVSGSSAATGEAAVDRLARLCAEDGVPLTVLGTPSAVPVMMGVQEPGAPLDLYRECEEADGGLLVEYGFGLGYIPRDARYNRASGLTVDLAGYRVAGGGQGDVLTPVYDDQSIRNELTVTRRDGSSAVAVDAASQQRHGVYSDSVELNLASDDGLADQAAWRLHLAGGEP